MLVLHRRIHGFPRRAALRGCKQAAPQPRCRGLRDADRVLYSNEVPLAELQQQLEQAIEEEDYEAAAQLRDVIQ